MTPLPPDWPQRQRACLRRDRVCRCLGCPEHQGRCWRPSSEAHHLDRNDHRLERLVGLCHGCHAQETARERWAKRTREVHPALKEGVL